MAAYMIMHSWHRLQTLNSHLRNHSHLFKMTPLCGIVKRIIIWTLVHYTAGG